MITWWPVMVSALCGLLLAALVLALILNPEFRRDLAAGQGKASIFGVISVEGVIIVILAGMFLGGLLYPVWRFDGANASAGKGAADTTALQTTIAEQQKKIAELEAGNRIELAELPRLLESLEPESEISKEIRALADENRGPWSPYSKSQDLLVSVPGELRDGVVLGCPATHGKTLELLSTYKRGDAIVRGRSTLRVKVTGLVFSASDCRDKLGYDLQLNCADAVRLFSDALLKCGRDQQPLWQVSDRLLPVSAVIVNTGD
jgi:hypothetical protein